jgi:hypothetical protein
MAGLCVKVSDREREGDREREREREKLRQRETEQQREMGRKLRKQPITINKQQPI